MTDKELAHQISLTHPSLMNAANEEERGSVTDMLFARLPSGIEARLAQALENSGRSDLAAWLEYQRPIEREYRRTVLTLAPTFLPEEVKPAVGISAANPPADVHSMAREEIYAGDFYNCDMIAHGLAVAGLAIREGGTYLDFGASSGRVVRNMWAAYPAAQWHACDPQEQSIAWARDNLDPSINFFVSPLSPPLSEIPDAYFDGVYAISIWSHFSERAALAWFAEMRRCIKPGGWLMFTTHGVNTLRYYAEYGLKPEEQIRAIHAALFRDGYVFEDVFGPAGDWTVPAVDWGMCYLLPSWVALNLVGKGWSLSLLEVGRSALNQDNYLLVRTAA
jgi:SAM-dependent methyltransferase